MSTFGACLILDWSASLCIRQWWILSGKLDLRYCGKSLFKTIVRIHLSKTAPEYSAAGSQKLPKCLSKRQLGFGAWFLNIWLGERMINVCPNQNPQLINSISMASLWKFQRAWVKALWAVSKKLLYRLTELFIQVASGCKCSTLFHPRISLFYVNICTNLLLPFFVLLWLALLWVGDWQTEHNILDVSELWGFSLHIRGKIQT